MVEPNALMPFSDWIMGTFLPVFFLLFFIAFGTVAGTNLIKIALPEKSKKEWPRIRLAVIKIVAALFCAIATFGFGFDYMAQFDAVEKMFGFDSAFTTLWSELGLIEMSGFLYDRVKTKQPKQ